MQRRSLIRRSGLASGLLAALASLASPAAAQQVIRFEEELAFDRPEAWALKYFSAAAQPTGFGAATRATPWSLELALEGGWLPSLSAEDRRVGFNGTKVEDLNKTSLFGRLAGRLGLPGGFTLTAAYVPPIEIGGARPRVLALSLGRPLFERRGVRLAAQLFGQRGTIEADITCDRESVAAGADPVRNPFGCEEPSRDEVTLRAYGVELALAFRSGSALEPYLSLAASRLEPEFQIKALYSGLADRTHQTTEGTLVTATAGLAYEATERTRVTAEVFYAPLDIQPRPEGKTESRDLLNVRFLLSYRLR